jgi:outer membrane protein insertion porin family
MIVLVLLFFSSISYKVEKINIEGNEYLKDGAIRRVMLTRTPNIFHKGFFEQKVFEGDTIAIRNLYNYNGFLDAQIYYELAFDSIKYLVNIQIKINEGIQTFVKDVGFKGNTIYTDSFLNKKMTIRTGEHFNKRKIDIDNYIITSMYDDIGYVDVNVQSDYMIEDDSAIIIHNIIEGEKQFVEKIELTGLNRTKENVVRGQIKIKPNDTFRYANILKSQRNLYNLGIFRSIRTQTQTGSEPNLKIVQFNFTEKDPMTVNFRVGYGTQDYLRFGAGFSHFNILGRAWHGKVEGKWSFAEYRLSSQITLPRFMIIPIKTTFGAFYQHKNEIGFNTRNRGGYIATQFNALNGKLSTKYDVENVRTYYTDYYSVENDWLLGLTINWLRDRRNDPFSTRSGYYVNMNFETSGIIMPSNVNYVRPTFEYRLFKPIQISVLAYSFKLGYVRAIAPSTEVPPYKRFYCGGTTSIRGYSEWAIGPRDEYDNPVGGNILFETSGELRFPIYKILGGAIFLDAGNIWQEYEEIDIHLRWGVGAGLRLMTPLGSVRLDYGIKLGRQPDESFGTLHFAIGEAF